METFSGSSELLPTQTSESSAEGTPSGQPASGAEGIRAYSDYRLFLSNYVRQKRQSSSSWSLSVWARQLGLKSPSTLLMVTNGQRSPGPKLVEKLCRHFKFTKEEAQYFQDLVSLQKVRQDVRLSMEVMKQIEARNPERGFRVLEHETFMAISSWHYYAIREMVRLEDFREDPEWIVRRLKFPVSALEITRAIGTMIALGLLKRDAQGRLAQADAHMDSPTDILSEALVHFHDTVLDLAKKSQNETHMSLREISGGTFAIRRENVARAKQLIRQFQVQLCELVESKPADEVYQLEVCFFPLTEKKVQGGE